MTEFDDAVAAEQYQLARDMLVNVPLTASAPAAPAAPVREEALTPRAMPRAGGGREILQWHVNGRVFTTRRVETRAALVEYWRRAPGEYVTVPGVATREWFTPDLGQIVWEDRAVGLVLVRLPQTPPTPEILADPVIQRMTASFDAMGASMRDLARMIRNLPRPFDVEVLRDEHLYPPPDDAAARTQWNDGAVARLQGRLNPAQRATFAEHGYFDARGSIGRDTYRIVWGSSGNIYRHTDTMRLCVAHPSPLAPVAVQVLCQFTLLTFDEPRFLSVANSLGVHPELPFANGQSRGVTCTCRICAPTLEAAQRTVTERRMEEVRAEAQRRLRTEIPTRRLRSPIEWT